VCLPTEAGRWAYPARPRALGRYPGCLLELEVLDRRSVREPGASCAGRTVGRIAASTGIVQFFAACGFGNRSDSNADVIKALQFYGVMLCLDAKLALLGFLDCCLRYLLLAEIGWPSCNHHGGRINSAGWAFWL
jgi:hypothetical protein